ncbi:MAG: cell division protein FtsQ/DivIB [Emergencia sp.]
MSEYNDNYYDEYDQIEFRQVDRKKKVRKKKHYFLRFLIFLAVLAGIGLFLSSSIFNVDSIEVEGNHFYSDEEVINMAGVRTGVNLFWGVDGSEISDSLEEDSYFSEVKIHRRLPSTLVIEVSERQQIAAITYGDDFIVIDSEGTILRKSSVNPKLTLLTGLTVSRLQVGEKVEAEEAAALDNTLKMLAAMQQGDFFFKKIDVSRVIIRAYIYDTLVVKGTPKQMLNAIERGDLQKVVNNLLENDTVRGTISLGDHNYMSFSPDFS